MNKVSPPASGQLIACPSCGHSNPAWYAACEKCGKQLTLKSATHQVSAPHQPVSVRPGCLTAYAVFVGISAALLAVAGVFLLLGIVTNRRMNSPLVLSIILVFILAGFYFLMSQGLMNQKNWARIAAIIIEIISIPGGLVTILLGILQFSPQAGNDPSLMICGSILRMGLSGYVIYWLSVNGKYFHK